MNTFILDYFWFASPVVKLVMLLLLFSSITSWAIIFQRESLLKKTEKSLDEFDQEFESSSDLVNLYHQVQDKEPEDLEDIEQIFLSGLREFARCKNRLNLSSGELTSVILRAMRVRQDKVLHALESQLSFLATIGSVSPFVGLFGTVWGIMSAFHALGQVQQATIAMVAPGISEALIATALGLFAAIPAVIAYNHFTHRVNHIEHRLDNFQESFLNKLYWLESAISE